MFAMSLLSQAVSGGSIVAALFAVIVGLVLWFPVLLEDGSVTGAGIPAVSTIRVALLLIMSVFQRRRSVQNTHSDGDYLRDQAGIPRLFSCRRLGGLATFPTSGVNKNQRQTA